jgi:hypothetical protein
LGPFCFGCGFGCTGRTEYISQLYVRYDEGFSMRATARVLGEGLTLARVDKPLKEEAVGC